MIKVNCIGYPRIGPKRELKNALEKYWKSEISENDLIKCANELKKNNWQTQKDNGVDYICSNDFSFYDQVLDTICLVGSIPERYKHKDGNVSFKTYFAMARGSQTKDLDVPALEMTKWFDTNYHYLVPEFSKNQKFKLSSNKPFDEFDEAKKLGFNTKPIILGPLTFLSLGKTTDESFKSIDLLDNLLPVYAEILSKLNNKGAEWIQIDEPILVKNQNADFTKLIKKTLNQLKKFSGSSKIILTTYFEKLDPEVEKEILESDIDGIHFDLVRGKISNINSLKNINKTISIGIIDGRNIWKSDVNKKIELVTEYSKNIKHLWISSSCPLLHTPYDLGLETKVPEKIKKWLSFSKQKLIELNHIKISLNEGNNKIKSYLDENKKDTTNRATSELIHDNKVKQRAKNITTQILNRKSNFIKRSEIQTKVFKLPLYPTTTIGSFPQTSDVRNARAKFKKNELSLKEYEDFLKTKTIDAIKKQEQIDIDVIVHGEFERNDMVEYFGEQLKGFTFTSSGWVQSYGSRCVKPPIIFGDVSRPESMTVQWSKFAQDQTKKIVKGMLTGPITILQWSFVRDDQPRKDTALQIAFAIRDEVEDLENNGIKMIQIDEPALREGLPLKKNDWKQYLDWAVKAFQISAAVAKDETQIHTHMCYAEFEDIIDAIAALDADVISIETSRSRMELLKTFEKFKYPNEVGPGVYDIHSPRVPNKNEMKELIQKASKLIDKKRIWVNPDCGLKTRGWPETIAALETMVQAAKELRTEK